MKNKTIIYLMSFFFVIISCSKDFTKVPAVGSLSDEALQNELGVNLKLTAAYSILDGVTREVADDWMNTGDNWWFDVAADDAHRGSTDGDFPPIFDIETYNWSTANSWFYGKWRALFASVNRANAVIALASSIEGKDFTNQIAQARFLRGHFNFELQKIYGNVPYISDENFANAEFNQPNPGPIWDKIEADFQYAIDNLPKKQEDIGRPTSWTAKAFLGKVYLFQSDYTEALSLFDEVIASGLYALNTEFLDNFSVAGDNSPESIFAIQFSTNGGANAPNGNLGGALNFPHQQPFGACCGFYQPTQDLVNAYKTDGSGLPLLDTFNQSDVANDYGINSNEPFTPHTGPLDPRLDYTVGRRGIDYNKYGIMKGKDWIRAGFSDISGPYLPKKNVYQSGEESSNQGTGSWGQQHSGINYHIMRYSDLLLMAAECAVESGDLSKALNYVNQVRNRAKNMTYVKNEDGSANAANYQIALYTSFANTDYARKAVRFERRLELAMEGHRLFDLRRWGVTAQVLNEYVQNEARTISNFGTKAKTYEAKMDLLPIPLTAIDLSGNILTQNPLY